MSEVQWFQVSLGVVLLVAYKYLEDYPMIPSFGMKVILCLLVKLFLTLTTDY